MLVRPSFAARFFPASTRLRAISTPSTSAPSFAAGNAVVPSPQPRSRTLSPFVIPSRCTSASPLSRMVAAMRVKSPFSQSALFGFMETIYDGQADRAICEFCYENIELAVLVTPQVNEARQFIVVGVPQDPEPIECVPARLWRALDLRGA